MTETAIKIEEVFKSKNPDMWEYLIKSRLFHEAVGKELADAVINCPQISKYHPEGSLYNHMDMVFKNAVDAGEDDMDVYWIATFHDVGKPTTMRYVLNEDNSVNRTTFYGHEYASVRYANWFLRKLGLSKERVEKIVWVISQHMRIMNFEKMRKSKKDELCRSEYIYQLVRFHNLDDMVNLFSPESMAVMKYIQDKENK